MTKHLPHNQRSKSASCRIVHLGKEVRFTAQSISALHEPANGAMVTTPLRDAQRARLSARIRRHMSAMGYSPRPPAIIAPGALA